MRRLILPVCAAALLLVHATAQDAGLVVGSGNYFSPIVANLERAVAFYHDGLGLDVMGTPSTAADNAPLRDMFGLPGAQLRWTVARPVGSRQGVEIVEISQAGGRPLDRRVTDQGAMTLVMSTSEDLDMVVNRVKDHGGTVISGPVAQTPTDARRAIVRDPDDHFVELIAADRNAAPLSPHIRLTVRDPRTGDFYAKALGLQGTGSKPIADLGLLTRTAKIAKSSAGETALRVPNSDLVIEFVTFGSASRRMSGRIQDPGSTRLQLQVRDLDAAIQAVVRAGGHVVSTGGMPVELPGGRGGSTRAAIVQDPDNLFLVLIQAAAPRG